MRVGTKTKHTQKMTGTTACFSKQQTVEMTIPWEWGWGRGKVGGWDVARSWNPAFLLWTAHVHRRRTLVSQSGGATRSQRLLSSTRLFARWQMPRSPHFSHLNLMDINDLGPVLWGAHLNANTEVKFGWRMVFDKSQLELGDGLVCQCRNRCPGWLCRIGLGSCKRIRCCSGQDYTSTLAACRLLE